MKLLTFNLLLAVVLHAVNTSYGEKRGGQALSSEEISVTLGEDFSVNVRVKFNFSGDFSIPAKLAFPESEWFDAENYLVIWNGKQVNSYVEKPPEGRLFIIKRVKYPSILVAEIPGTEYNKNTAEISYRYIAPLYIPGVKGEESNPVNKKGRYIEYILVTGATWKGVIVRTDFSLDTGAYPCKKIQVLENSYAGSCSGNIYLIQLENFKPVKNIRLLLKE